ncbi:hypothetical protein DOTSEDRAFT_125125 [Dothistroma septosporum NZE10]|uniref:tRNA dimethylallyltransferase n=1 Tax=Dothistroma septosporum (strain NZE10 / CBS 128990) TaxID=675120 RepID=N1PZ35_DOTSN|nr:hypothetical protein DOTSEDRAFT_125125 [Dothistroma septosporum NZE10]
MARTPPRKPLVVVVGATGTGKSELAVEVARRCNGEIINGDAMQLYAGLPIITNKIAPQEQQGIPHHLLGTIGLHEQTWVVSTFVREALKTIEEIRSRGRLPILVGGTHYYTQSLLFRDRLAEDETERTSGFAADTSVKWPILRESTHVLSEELRKVDPVMADRWHPNDRRKIQRSLEIYLQTGRRASDIYADQRAAKEDGQHDSQSRGGGMRFPTLLLWVHAEANTLRTRLNDRVEKMLDRGLLQEIESLSTIATKQPECGGPVDKSRGIWVSIGYKEFEDFTRAQGEPSVDPVQLEKMKAESIERMQVATRQYAKRQVRWIRIKLVNALADSAASGSLYLLDGSDVSRFNDNVIEPATNLAVRFLRGEQLPQPASFSSAAEELLQPTREYDFATKPEKWAKQHCSACNVTCVTPEQWQAHTRSKAHKKLNAKLHQAEQTPKAPG